VIKIPYIKQEGRAVMDMVVKAMCYADVQADGDLNYILFKFCKTNILPGYNNYKNFIGELRQCAVEIERRLLAPYEDLKILENGDVD